MPMPLSTLAPTRLAPFCRQSPTVFDGRAGRIQLLPKGVVYCRLDHDGEVDAAAVHDILLCVHAVCTDQRPLLLVDRARPYWLSFEAQYVLMRHTGLAAVAYWIRRPISASMARHASESYFKHVPVEVFRRRGPAVRWLASFLPTTPKMVPEA